MSKKFIQLGPCDLIEERSFTHPVQSRQDLATLQYMLDRLRQVVRQRDLIPDRPPPWILYVPESKYRYHRLTISNLTGLATGRSLTAVGFCGQKRPGAGADRGPLEAIDEVLIAEFPQYPHLLSYSTLQRVGGDACNLVLFDSPKGIEHWALGAAHAYAVSLAPAYYASIRLHNAVLPGGLPAGQNLELVRTKYFDYQQEPIWGAVRELHNQTPQI